MRKSYVAVPAVALALASFMLVNLASADTTAGQAAKPETAAVAAAPAHTDQAKPDVQALLNFSKDGNTAVRQINGARIAIFNGDPKLAASLINQAKESVAKAAKDAPTFKINVTTSVDGKKVGTTSETDKADMVPVDGQILLSDDYVPTPEKQAHIKKANENFKNHKNKEALDELRLAEINVTYNRYLLPMATTAKYLDQASTLMDEHKYYEANLALKSIIDSLSVDSVQLNEAPPTKS